MTTPDKDQISPAATAAFMDLMPLLDKVARLVAECPFEDSGDRKDLSLLVACYFAGSAVAVHDRFNSKAANVHTVVTALRTHLNASAVGHKEAHS